MTRFGSPEAYIRMAGIHQQALNESQIAELVATISAGRFGTYLAAAGHDPDRALRLYMWNAQVGEAFHIPIQAVEVGLRNRISAALEIPYGVEWWKNQGFLQLADQDRQADLLQVQRRIRNRRLVLCTGQVVAGLSFGFWVGMLQPKYNPPLWSQYLRTAFPHLPSGKGRKSLATSAARVAHVRNRIWHHEPIIKNDLSKDYSTVTELLDWLCPTTSAWIKPHCRVPQLLRQKP